MTLATTREQRIREVAYSEGREDGLSCDFVVDLVKKVARYEAALEWFSDEGHYTDTYRIGAGFVDALGCDVARAALLGWDPDKSHDGIDEAWAARKALPQRGEEKR